MKRILLFILTAFFLSCTSNTIYEEPKDLIPRDSMVLLLKDMYIASSAKNIRNKNRHKNLSYLPLVYEKYKIDSARFKNSNFYYTSKIEDYGALLDEVFSEIQKEQTKFSLLKRKKDSIKKDSIEKNSKDLTNKMVPKEVQEDN